MGKVTVTCNHCEATVTDEIQQAIAWDASHQKAHEAEAEA